MSRGHAYHAVSRLLFSLRNSKLKKKTTFIKACKEREGREGRGAFTSDAHNFAQDGPFWKMHRFRILKYGLSDSISFDILQPLTKIDLQPLIEDEELI